MTSGPCLCGDPLCPRCFPDQDPVVEPELDFCSRCHEHTIFHRAPNGEVYSECCYAPPIEADMEDR